MLPSFKKALPLVFLLFLLVATWLVYKPGLQGGFLFDDYPNLESLGSYGGVVDLETFKNFTLNGISGPLGRPISLASFVLDDNTWPSEARWFKPTNVKIHLLAGLLLVWATLLLMRLLNRDEYSAVWIALLTGAIWMLHPYMVSTTLYVIQRMAQLSTLFMFVGMVGYFHGRLLFVRGAREGYVWMSVSLCIGAVLAMLSKENGILLPVVIAAIESCFPDSMRKLNFWWKLCFLWGPCLIVGLYLLQKLNLSGEPMTGRRFTQLERILTQPRIMWEYLYHLYIPRIEGRGLFQDGYQVSKGLFSPISTLVSILALLVLWVGAFKYRKQFPLFAISILFFFASHLLESTWLNLELYFEHRNYVASAFLFLPLAAGFVALVKYIDVKLVVLCTFGVLMLLGFLTWQRASLWSSSDRLEIYWAASTPESARAQNRVGTLLLQMDRVDESIQYLQAADDRFKTSSLLTINLLLVKVYANVAIESDFLLAAERMRHQPFDAQAVKGLRSLVEKIVSRDEGFEYPRYALTLIDTVRSNGNYGTFPMFARLHYYLKGMLFLKLEDYESALINYHQAMDLYAETDAALSMVADVANAGRPDEALILLQHAKNIYETQSVASLQRSKSVYNAEFERMKYILELAKTSLRPSESESD
jgi:tetratricopeptide (TPR) repeat protein